MEFDPTISFIDITVSGFESWLDQSRRLNKNISYWPNIPGLVCILGFRVSCQSDYKVRIYKKICKKLFRKWYHGCFWGFYGMQWYGTIFNSKKNINIPKICSNIYKPSSESLIPLRPFVGTMFVIVFYKHWFNLTLFQLNITTPSTVKSHTVCTV